MITRIDPKIKEQAEKVLEQLGISMATAMEMYLRQIVLQKRIPFEIALPNDVGTDISSEQGGQQMETYKIGTLVYAKLGALPVVGTIVSRNEKTGKYLVRFSGTQQDYYSETELTPYSKEQ